jgi:4-amino-4-deoxy-L-arabinose transferase-like glycosyltransferase
MFLQRIKAGISLRFSLEFNKSKLLIIVFLFLAGQIMVSLLFNLNSVIISRGDSLFYLQSADEVLDLNSFQKMYAGYIFALHLSLLVSQSGLMIVIAQALLVIFSAYSLFSLTKEYGDDLAAWISTSFYLLFPMLTQWTRYILTESIFYSLIII